MSEHSEPSVASDSLSRSVRLYYRGEEYVKELLNNFGEYKPEKWKEILLEYVACLREQDTLTKKYVKEFENKNARVRLEQKVNENFIQDELIKLTVKIRELSNVC